MLDDALTRSILSWEITFLRYHTWWKTHLKQREMECIPRRARLLMGRKMFEKLWGELRPDRRRALRVAGKSSLLLRRHDFRILVAHKDLENFVLSSTTWKSNTGNIALLFPDQGLTEGRLVRDPTLGDIGLLRSVDT